MTPDLRIGSLFSGYLGLDRGVQSVFGGRTAWVSDIDDGAVRVLKHRAPGVPNLGDITRIRWGSVEPVGMLTGGSPCQDMSGAGRREGLMPHTRSGLWNHMADAITILRPKLVIWENVRGAVSAPAFSDVEPCPWCLGDAGDGEPALRAFGAVLADLADRRFDAVWTGLPASDVGAPHGRFRLFLLAWDATDPAALDLIRRAAGRGAAEDTDGAARGERRVAAPGEAEGGRAQADARGRGGASAADTSGAGLEGRVDPGLSGAASDGEGSGREVGPLLGGDVDRAGVRWGTFGPAVRRWERVLSRPAPAPTLPDGRGGAHRLSPLFTEWMMGLPEGHVTDPAIWDGWDYNAARNAQLKLCGNGVVPQQAAAACRRLAGQALLAAASQEVAS